MKKEIIVVNKEIIIFLLKEVLCEIKLHAFYNHLKEGKFLLLLLQDDLENLKNKNLW